MPPDAVTGAPFALAAQPRTAHWSCSSLLTSTSYAGFAQHDPTAFEVQRRALFEEALSEIPPAHQAPVRARVAEVPVRMAADGNRPGGWPLPYWE